MSSHHSNSKSLLQLRTLHPRFIYESYDWKLEKIDQDNSDLKLSFTFTLENSLKNQPPVSFHPTVTIHNVTQEQISAIPPQIFENFVFHLGLIEIPSYWKAACSPQIIIRAHNSNKYQSTKIPKYQNTKVPFTNHQTDWWQDLLIKGLGEFFYTNNIDFTKEDFVSWEVEEEKEEEKIKIKSEEKKNTPHPIPHTQLPNTNYQLPKYQITRLPDYLIPVGGGKDSALTLGLLDKHNLPYSCFILEPHSPATQAIIEKSHPQQVITATRTIDPTLLKLNSLGYMNGHTPFSAYLAFLSSFVALIFGIEHILLSNERSANEGNIEFHSQTINHQYSKTFEFENKFREYVEEWIYGKEVINGKWKIVSGKRKGKENPTNDQLPIAKLPNYSSILRPLYEIQIARLFAQYPQYHSIFRSCNVGQKQNIWCHSCPKCLFVFAMLFPFIETKIITTQIFDHNLYKDENLLPLMLELLGETKHKPLECVGTYEEVLAAVFLSIEKYKENNLPLPYILTEVSEKILNNKHTSENLEKMTKNLLNSWNSEHNLPEKLGKILKKEVSL